MIPKVSFLLDNKGCEQIFDKVDACWVRASRSSIIQFSIFFIFSSNQAFSISRSVFCFAITWRSNICQSFCDTFSRSVWVSDLSCSTFSSSFFIPDLLLVSFWERIKWSSRIIFVFCRIISSFSWLSIQVYHNVFSTYQALHGPTGDFTAFSFKWVNAYLPVCFSLLRSAFYWSTQVVMVEQPGW